jgi:hypothetical protein
MTTEPRTTIDEWIPDDRIVDDCRRVVVEDGGGKIEYDRGVVEVPDDVRFDVVSKAYLSPRIEIGFGECFRSLVAIGGLVVTQNGIARASLRRCRTFWKKAFENSALLG